MKRMLLIVALLCTLGVILPAQAEVVWHDPTCTVEVRSAVLDGEDWLFLPSGSDLSALLLEQDGQVVETDWAAVSSENRERRHVHSGLWNGKPLHVMVSQNLRSLHLQSSDPEQRGREWLEDSIYHERCTTASLKILDKYGAPSYRMAIAELRGRGNSSWSWNAHRRPYQFKLENRADLLETGLRHEYSNTWVLLTNDADDSLLRNQLGLDIAKELGMESTSRCEQVDLYYDGDYRGTYLLAEKLEVAEHSVDIMNFDGLLKPINQLLHVTDPSLLGSPLHNGHQAEGVNEYGSYSHVPGVYDNQDTDAGGYLLELDDFSIMNEYTWFSLVDDMCIAIKNPEYAGPTMIRYVQDIFFRAYEAMLNYGVHPRTGEMLEDLIDVDSFTRSHLVQEILHNSNAYAYSSTFFVLPQGEKRLYAGPVWDFDHIASTPTPGLRDNSTFSHAFYRTTVFQRRAKEIWKNEVEPLLAGILFGNRDGRYLKPLNAYMEQLRISWQMNQYRFFGEEYGYTDAEKRFEEAMAAIENFFKTQCEFLGEEIRAWGSEQSADCVEIFFELPYADPSDPTLCEMLDETYHSFLMSTSVQCVQEATEEEWGRWQVCFTIYPKPHCDMPETITVSVNGADYLVEVKNNKAVLALEYEDYYYRPAVADGVDYGLVFDFDCYTDNHPELLEEELSREEIIRHFRDVGMAEGECANDYFEPLFILDVMYEECEALGDNWPLYYECYMENHKPWTKEMGFVYEPDLMLAEE